MCQDYIAVSNEKLDEKQECLSSRNSWIMNLPTKNRCKEQCPYAPYCDNPYCAQHGQKERYKLYNRTAQFFENSDQVYNITNRIDHYLTPHECKQAREQFFNLMYNEIGSYKYVWRWHFVMNVPHLHVLISVIIPLRTKVPNKRIWNNVLRTLKHPSPSSASTYCRKAKHTNKSIHYLFELKPKHRRISIWRCPPALDKRWATWAMGDMKRRIPRRSNANV